MSVNQQLLPDAIRNILAECQREKYYGEVTVTIVKGEIQSIRKTAKLDIGEVARTYLSSRVVVRVKDNPRGEVAGANG